MFNLLQLSKKMKIRNRAFMKTRRNIQAAKTLQTTLSGIKKCCTTNALVMLAAWVDAAISAKHVSVEASYQGSAVAIIAHATINAPYALIWQTLTDYDHLSEFIPGLLKSHVIERRSNAAIVEQTGGAGLLYYKFAPHRRGMCYPRSSNDSMRNMPKFALRCGTLIRHRLSRWC